jgi:hypothetical protein
MSRQGGGLYDRPEDPQPPRDAAWKMTAGEWVFFGALTFMFLIFLINAPQVAIILAALFASFGGGIYVGWKGKGNYDMERILGRWLT